MPERTGIKGARETEATQATPVSLQALNNAIVKALQTHRRCLSREGLLAAALVPMRKVDEACHWLFSICLRLASVPLSS
ncbi:hypothetical protein LOC71_02170 [Rhodopirellula sp. JC740]|uniref:Uncharacterized protein n=1 Tax=Rhodopirellula halodulae TaxID=2894198 RepID=A0ABS8NDR3_9BACT|nr:hypothetical protein [Rhodopirellula sp. JC740]MCC9641062.1 hypothetical protein [Rhodopirellula sp. JC740]